MSQDELPSSGKRKPVKKAKSPAIEGIEDNSIPLSKFELLAIEQVFAQAAKRHKNDLLEDKRLSQKEFAYISSILEEYLSGFALIGFSMTGDRVCIFNAPTHKDEGALVDLLRSTFIDIANNRE